MRRHRRSGGRFSGPSWRSLRLRGLGLGRADRHRGDGAGENYPQRLFESDPAL